MQNKHYFFWVFFIPMLFTQAQNFLLKGTFYEEQLPAEFIELRIKAISSEKIYTVITDENGFFSIDLSAGNYSISVVQFDTMVWEKLIALQESVDIGKIVLEAETVHLKEVAVEARKKLIERKADRLVFHVENSTASAGGTALDALKATPGLQVTQQAIRLAGKDQVMVLIDDRATYLSGEELIRYLDGMHSSELKSIEVITTPPAKYDAEGNSGIINIITKKVKQDSWNANVSSSYQRSQRNSQRYATAFNMNKSGLTLQSALSIGNTRYLREWNSDLYYPNEFWQNKSKSDIDNRSSAARILLAYQLNPKVEMGVRYTFNTGKYSLDGPGETTIQSLERNELKRKLINSSDETFKSTTHLLGLYSVYALDSIGKKLFFDIDYFTYNSDEDRRYMTHSLNAPNFKNRSDFMSGQAKNDNDRKNFSAKVAMDYPLDWVKIDFGTKISFSTTNNNVETLKSDESGENSFDPMNSNAFDFTENNQAFYVSANKKLGEHWEFQAGLRAEATQTKGYSKNLDQRNTNNYFKLFPTAYVMYSFNNDSQVGINYTRRINRPSYESLNPFRSINNAYSYNEGNPFLTPAFSHNAELTFTYKKWDSRLYYTRLRDGISQASQINPDTKHNNYIWMNYVNSDLIGLSQTATISPFSWWTTTNSAVVYYSKTNTIINPKEIVKGWSADLSIQNELTLNAQKTLFFNVNYFQYFGGFYQNYSFKPYSKFSASVKYLLLHKQLELSLHGTDIFKGREYYSQTVNGVKQSFKNIWDMQSIRISAVYRFGNKNMSLKNRETANQEELNRF